MSDKLKQYKDKLNSSQIADGMNAANENAVRLVEDAKLLFENDRLASALALAILSIEESGKVAILRSLAISSEGKDLKEGWKRYRSHRAKNAHWIAVDLILKGANKLSDFSTVTDENADHPHVLDQLKQVALYTDCLGDAHWSIPEKAIDKELARNIIRVAGVFSKKSKHTQEEVDLWIKHIGPSHKSSQSVQNGALLKWFNEMKEKGLIREGQIQFEEFVNEF
ncbi:MAG: AbiV family abortive infection protein [Candidatus Delongbacteria bacterium]|jgi:AbiV family abortive infection protein|nr:AbiV family abortive infection protein [Candidatus Delongbacteria bacterium]